MSEYIPITTDIRLLIGCFTTKLTDFERDKFNQLCDVLDSIHANLERENEGMKAELDRARGEWDYWENTHVELPKDMDDEPICIGDVMEWPTTGETFEVVGIGDGVLFYVEDGNEKADWTGASTKRHHKPDTWERIIEDAIRGDGGNYGCLEERFDAMVPALVARCKALAGDAE